ncbi:hypothetical protein Thiowin_03512 [Thiorhodovibrio winogradskyi]|uniref:Secreted protein n=1 Tax=Thiorhodovibrio winogradskyi TaxID=77007 RepID=A0ABZ0SCZ4_9GAMM|nr:hypothetical protein [Thiorhodovibrio winogradskyi]
MKTNIAPLTLIAMTLSAFLLWSCDNQSEPVEPDPELSEQAGEAVEESVEETQEAAAQAAEAAQKAARKAAERTDRAIEEGGDRIESATD